MRKWFAIPSLVLALLMGTLSSIAAQTPSTPAAGGSAGAVVVYGSDGQPESEVTVNAITDPFKDYDTGSAPQRGFHFVAADVTIAAVGSADIDPSAYGFAIVDTDGFVYQTTYVYRSSDATEAKADLPSDPISAGNSVSGLIFFQVLDGTEPAVITYQPSYDRLVTVADLRDAPVQQGDAVQVVSSEGAPVATITVEDVTSPLKDFDPSYAPQRGFQYVGVTVTIENTGDAAFSYDPYGFYLVDEQGFIGNYASIVQTEAAETANPQLQAADLEAGQSVTGLVTFQVLSGTEPSLIYYAPSSDRHIRLAEYGEGQAPKPSGTPSAGGGLGRTPNADVTPEAGETPSAVANTPGCEGVLEWGQATAANVAAWTEAFSGISGVFSGDTVDPQAARDAADAVAGLADKQAAVDTPEIAQDAQDAAVQLFDETAQLLDDLATAIEDGDAAATAAAVKDFTDYFSGGQSDALSAPFDALAKACPELDSIDG